MKKLMLVAISLGFSLALNAGAAEKMGSPTLAVLSDQKASMQDEVSAIDAYVSSVEKDVSSLTRKEAKLSADELKKVTNEKWSKIHTYSKGDALMRMKMYPAEGSKKTEEFYYYDGKPVFVFLEENGAGKENHDADAKGEKFYFTEKGTLIGAMSSDGQEMDMKSATTTKMAEKLMKESTAFRAEVK